MEEKTKAYKNRGELVFETLKREILDLELKPGQMISENEICERFGVSRTPGGKRSGDCRSRGSSFPCPIPALR